MGRGIQAVDLKSVYLSSELPFGLRLGLGEGREGRRGLQRLGLSLCKQVAAFKPISCRFFA